MIINKISISVVVLLGILTIVAIAGSRTTTHNADALTTTKDGREIYVPGAYTIHNDGTVTYDKFDGPTSHPPYTASTSASASKSDFSAAGANSKTEVKCLMFCAVFSNTNAAGSAASNSNSNSDSSRINSPSAVPSSSNPITTTTTQVKSDSSLSPVECIDNTGSPNDEGYGQGYVNGNRDARLSNRIS
jgi:hypothetical protein